MCACHVNSLLSAWVAEGVARSFYLILALAVFDGLVWNGVGNSTFISVEGGIPTEQ